MAMISFNPKWGDKRAASVSNDKARKVKALLLDLPGDLDETKYDFLKCVERIYFSDGTTFPEQPKQPASGHVNANYYKETQGRDMAVGN